MDDGSVLAFYRLELGEGQVCSSMAGVIVVPVSIRYFALTGEKRAFI